MLTRTRADVAARLPGPPELLPGCPDAVVDLQADAGVELVQGQWRYSDARVEEIEFVEVGHPDDPLGPGLVPNRTYDVTPHAEAAEYDDSGWRVLAPADTQLRLSQGRVCFNWYRIAVTIPERVGDFDPTGASVVFEVTIDDHAEVWVNGALPHTLGDTGGPVIAGFNAPNRVLLTDDARPGQRFQIAVFGINGPISASPRNYIWMRTATPRLLRRPSARVRRRRLRSRSSARIRRSTRSSSRTRRSSGWPAASCSPRDRCGAPTGALLFSSPNTNAIYRWHPSGRVSVFRSKSGYTGTDIGRFTQPGSNGLTFDPQGRLTICQHGNRRVIRVEPHGNVTVLVDRYDGRRLNSPNDLVYRSDGTLFFTDPPFGLPAAFDDPDKELALQRRVRRPRRRGHTGHRRARGSERDRLLARRALPVRRQLGPRAQGRHALRARPGPRRDRRHRAVRHDRAPRARTRSTESRSTSRATCTRAALAGSG